MKKCVFGFIWIISCQVYAQSFLDGPFAFSQTNQMMFNPAAMGSKNCIAITGSGTLYRNTYFTSGNWAISVEVPFLFGKAKQNGIGFGVVGGGNYFATTVIDGAMRFALNYRRLNLGPGDLSVGMDFGLATKRYNYPIPSSPDSTRAGETFDMSLGVTYAGDNFYTGLSCTHLNGGSISPLLYRFKQNLHLNGGGFIGLGAQKNWSLNPNGIVRTDFSYLSFQGGLNAICFLREKHAILFGATYGMIGYFPGFTSSHQVFANAAYAVRFKGGGKGALTIGYNLEVLTLTHQFVLRYCFPGIQTKFQRVFF